MSELQLEKYSSEAKSIIAKAQLLADNRNHKEVNPIHFISASLSLKEVTNIFNDAGISLDSIFTQVNHYLDSFDRSKEMSYLSRSMIDILARAEKEANANMSSVSIEHLLNSFTYETRGAANDFLKSFNIVAGGLKPFFYSSKEDARKMSGTQYITNLTQLAKNGVLDPVIGRHAEVRRLINILGRRHKNHPILVGEVGVGKKSIVNALALKIASGNVSRRFSTLNVISLNVSALTSGIKQRGEVEQRMKKAIGSLKNEDTILFIDGIESLFTQGSSMSGTGDLISSLLSKDNLRIITSTTTDAFKKMSEKENVIIHQLTPIMVEPATSEQAIEILRGIAIKYEAFHRVKIGDPAIISAVKLAKRYLQKRALPDSAIDLIDEASARKKFEVDGLSKVSDVSLNRFLSIKAQLVGLIGDDDNESILTKAKLEREVFELSPVVENILTMVKQKRRGSQNQECVLSEEDVAGVLEDWTGIPLSKMLEGEVEKMGSMEDDISSRVVGQMEAVKAVSKAIRRSRLGIRDLGKPIGSFMFLGSSGTGKTEMAKALSKFLFDDEKSMIRIDCSELMERHMAQRLIGSPPGYAQADEGGMLTEAVSKNPYSVLLFDEIEKAHPDVFNLLLQMLDDGRLTDGRGKTVDFTNTVVIMTSNIGSGHILDAPQETFSSPTGDEELRNIIQTELRKSLRPELLNRIDEIVIFKPLSKEVLKKIIDIQLKLLDKLLEPKKVSVVLTDEAKIKLINDSYIPGYGARPLKRAIQSHISDYIAEKMVNGQCKSGCVVNVSVNDCDSFNFNF